MSDPKAMLEIDEREVNAALADGLRAPPDAWPAVSKSDVVIAGVSIFVDQRVPRGEMRFVQNGVVVGVIRGIR